MHDNQTPTEGRGAVTAVRSIAFMLPLILAATFLNLGQSSCGDDTAPGVACGTSATILEPGDTFAYNVGVPANAATSVGGVEFWFDGPSSQFNPPLKQLPAQWITRNYAETGEDPALYPLRLYTFDISSSSSAWHRGDTGHFLRMKTWYWNSYYSAIYRTEPWEHVCTTDHGGGLRAHACDAPRFICAAGTSTNLSFVCSEKRRSYSEPWMAASSEYWLPPGATMSTEPPHGRWSPRPSRTNDEIVNWDCGREGDYGPPIDCNTFRYRVDDASFVDVFDTTSEEIDPYWNDESLRGRGIIGSGFLRLPSRDYLATVSDVATSFRNRTGYDFDGAKWFRSYDVGACSVILRWVDVVDTIHGSLVPELSALMSRIAEERFRERAGSVAEWFIDDIEVSEGFLNERAFYGPVLKNPTKSESRDGFVVKFPIVVTIDSVVPLVPLKDPIIRPVFTVDYANESPVVLGQTIFPFPTPSGFTYTVDNYGEIVDNHYKAADVEDTAEAIMGALTVSLPWVFGLTESRLIRDDKLAQFPTAEDLVGVLEALITVIEETDLEVDDLVNDPLQVFDDLADDYPQLVGVVLNYIGAFRPIVRMQNRPEGIEFVLAEWRSNSEYQSVMSEHPELCVRPQGIANSLAAGYLHNTYAYYGGPEVFLNDRETTAAEAGLP